MGKIDYKKELKTHVFLCVEVHVKRRTNGRKSTFPH